MRLNWTHNHNHFIRGRRIKASEYEEEEAEEGGWEREGGRRSKLRSKEGRNESGSKAGKQRDKRQRAAENRPVLVDENSPSQSVKGWSISSAVRQSIELPLAVVLDPEDINLPCASLSLNALLLLYPVCGREVTSSLVPTEHVNIINTE